MNELSYGDKIFKFLQKCNRQCNTPDLHTFRADIENGTVWVECRGFEVYIESRTYDNEGKEKITEWAGTTIAAANRLEKLKIDLTTVDM